MRHRGGNYYLSATVGGRKIRKSLGTSNMRIAKMKRDATLGPLRSAATSKAGDIKTIGDALSLIELRTISKPGLAAKSVEYYEELFRVLRQTLPLLRAGGSWTKDEAAKWWADLAGKRSATQANNALSAVRRMTGALIESGLRADDPAKGLKRMRPKSSAVENLPPRETLPQIVESIRSQGKARSEMMANLVEFLAWSGLRISQALAVEWEHIQGGKLLVIGGIQGAKGASGQFLPMAPTLKALMERMRYPGATGRLFTVKSPREALKNACKRLGIPHLRVHDLRHWFASHAIQSGVDIPTVAKWLRHKDKGVLAMRTYGHLRDEHSIESAKKLG